MRVKDVMRTDFVTVSPSMSWQEAAALLLAHHVAAAPVVEDDKIVGILSEKDLFRGLFPRYEEWIKTPHGFHDLEAAEPDTADMEGKTVRDVMSKKVITTDQDAPVFRIGALMVTSGIHHVPVLAGVKLIGLVNRGTIYRAIMQKSFGV